MSSFSTIALVKLMLLGVLSFALLLSVSSIYMGPRYGKRLPYDSSNRVALRSSSPRTIQSRSQVRFYAGSRYGGKRSYWEPSMPDSESADFFRQQQQIQQLQAAQAGSLSPYDCFYVSFVGVRCLPRQSSAWNNNVGESDEDSGSPSGSISNSLLSGSPSSSLTVGGGGGADAS